MGYGSLLGIQWELRLGLFDITWDYCEFRLPAVKLGNRWGSWVTDFLISPKDQWRWQNTQQNTCKPIIRIHQQDHHCHPIVFIPDIQKDIDFMKTLKPTNIIHHITKLKDKKKHDSIWCCSHICGSKSIFPEHGQTLRDCDWRKLSLPFPAISSSFTFGSRSSAMAISFSLH